MARKQVAQHQHKYGNFNTNNTTAIIYMRGELFDGGTDAAYKDAGAKGCRMILLRNEQYYDHSEPGERVIGVNYCYTDDEGIEKEYKAKGIDVIKLAPLEEIEGSESDDSGTELTETQAMLKAAKERIKELEANASKEEKTDKANENSSSKPGRQQGGQNPPK